MFVRINESGGRRYLQVVESYRNEAGKPRHRVIANLGRIDGMEEGHLDALIRGLCRAAGRDEPATPEITHAPARAYGNVFALHELWKDLGFDHALGRALRSGKRRLDVEALVRAMVFNRLCAPDSKLGCLRWLETVAMPAMPEGVTHQHLLRAMDALMDHADRLETELAGQIRPLVDQDLAVVFYDLTTVRIHGEGEVDDDLRAFGMNKDIGGIAHQFVLGVVQTALADAELFDGKLALITNAPDLTPADAVARYKALADIERGFRVLKSDIEIAPVHHRLPDRIRAHALICFLALVLHRVMRMRLKARDHAASPRTALDLLGRIQRHQAKIDERSVDGLSSTTPEQLELFETLNLPKPA